MGSVSSSEPSLYFARAISHAVSYVVMGIIRTAADGSVRAPGG